MAYWTKSEEAKPVYHVYKDCSEGEKIEKKNRVDGVAPAGRDVCEKCAARMGVRGAAASRASTRR